ncbi:hypothetical protein SAMN04487969_101124 [Paenibacillus algorifonticola]|uniref:Uncharacterized protein n=1 Tax=Paenibacillus algorifonticola TaxID=684063 RepID=A0A1I1XVI7_9BACL|nr:hypothetical protein [Paenibacillus algorifonticola]SFE11346.1 hypothetical protein SAMN04487969_101124 [Paenibacillus algorifonticola]
MLYAVKGNKQLKIDEADATGYLKLGYDIAKEENGELVTIEVSPSKTVTYAEHKKALDRIAELEAADPDEKLQAENKALKEKLAEANKKLKEATGG